MEKGDDHAGLNSLENTSIYPSELNEIPLQLDKNEYLLISTKNDKRGDGI